MFLIIHFKFVVSLMYGTFCLIKCILELIYMHFYTYNVLATEMSTFQWNALLNSNQKLKTSFFVVKPHKKHTQKLLQIAVYLLHKK